VAAGVGFAEAENEAVHFDKEFADLAKSRTEGGGWGDSQRVDFFNQFPII
jgi:hypothetical protein